MTFPSPFPLNKFAVSFDVQCAILDFLESDLQKFIATYVTGEESIATYTSIDRYITCHMCKIIKNNACPMRVYIFRKLVDYGFSMNGDVEHVLCEMAMQLGIPQQKAEKIGREFWHFACIKRNLWGGDAARQVDWKPPGNIGPKARLMLYSQYENRLQPFMYKLNEAAVKKHNYKLMFQCANKSYTQHYLRYVYMFAPGDGIVCWCGRFQNKDLMEHET